MVEVGGVYSVVRGSGTFGVVKVLAAETVTGVIYVRVYRARFTERTDPANLKSEQHDADAMLRELGMGIGTLPVTADVFVFWEPDMLFVADVSPEEESNLSECFGGAKAWDKLIYA